MLLRSPSFLQWTEQVFSGEANLQLLDKRNIELRRGGQSVAQQSTDELRSNASGRFHLILDLGFRIADTVSGPDVEVLAPDSSVYLYDLSRSCVFLLEHVGGAGMIHNAFWIGPDALAIVSLVNGVGYVQVISVVEGKSSTFSIDEKPVMEGKIDEYLISAFGKNDVAYRVD
jgi:hypothetical protein